MQCPQPADIALNTPAIERVFYCLNWVIRNNQTIDFYTQILAAQFKRLNFAQLNWDSHAHARVLILCGWVYGIA